jgi:uncharacterized protein
MSLSIYSSLVPVSVHFLNNLSAILGKGAEFSKSRNIDESVLVTDRLAPNMFPLSRQIQIACDMVKGGAARLAGIEIPKFEDNETTLAQLQERIRKTVAFVESIPAAKFNGSETRQIKLQAGPRELEFVGDQYLHNWVLPNLYFHVTTAYNILRHNGVELGKIDYLGG